MRTTIARVLRFGWRQLHEMPKPDGRGHHTFAHEPIRSCVDAIS